VNASLAGRVIALNPDVFPRDPNWARKHLDLVAGLPEQQTRLFGAPLYYDDGSLMHGGRYFDIDTGLSMAGGQPRSCSMVRVEHYGKGAPSWSETFLKPRPVPAVTGAFISADRAWFEKLGGFTEDYVFGHYEDADICLKSLNLGTPSWIHDLRMWHLEGKGSTRLPPHEGGSLVNRWLFSKRWLPTIDPLLVGQTPAHPLMHPLPQPPQAVPPMPSVPRPSAIAPQPAPAAKSQKAKLRRSR
jgi:GT2 family glycosyltransferase